MLQTFYAGFDRAARKAGQTVTEWVMCFVEQCRSCRECHARVTLFEEICPHCGIRSPARVSLAMSVTAAGVFVLGLVLLACL